MEREEAVGLLRDLVACPSPSGEEAAAVELFLARLGAHGFRTHRDAAGNAVAEIGAGAERVLLLGHIDTVRGFPPVVLRAGRLYGRGAVDAKGPLCAFAAAAARAAAAGLPRRVIVCGAVEEETPGSRGARHVARALRPHACVVGEPGGWDGIVLGYKGRARLRVRVRRSRAHGAAPTPTAAEEGVRLWRWLEARTGGRRGGDAFRRVLPTLETVRTEREALAERVELEVGLRLPEGFRPEAFLRALREAFPGVEAELGQLIPAYRVPRRGGLVAAFVRGIRRAGGRPRFLLKTGTADMNVVGPAWGVPILAYGPGDARLDHTPEEHLDLEEYWRAVEILTGVLRDPLLVGRRA